MIIQNYSETEFEVTNYILSFDTNGTYSTEYHVDLEHCGEYCTAEVIAQPHTIYGRVQIAAHNIVGASNLTTCTPIWLEQFGIVLLVYNLGQYYTIVL